MAKINLDTSKAVVPVIYAYTTPEIKRHDGWTKIGYTEQSAEERIEQQVGTSDVEYKLEWQGNAVYDDGSGDTFTDHDFHAYLQKGGIERGTRVNANGKTVNTEWFRIAPSPAKYKFYDFRSDRGILKALGAIPYELRDEQETAVSGTVDYYKTHEKGEYLWNAKPRFGKTLSVYDFCKRIGAVSVLIVTNRPAIANSWYQDYVRFMGDESGYKFISGTDALKGRPYVLSRQDYLDCLISVEPKGYIEFISLQDLKGSKYFSPNGIDKLKYIADTNWDVLVVDEAHEGVDTYKTDTAFDHIKRKFTLHLSGTPFKALANDKFPGEAIFNWTYADEQAAKRDWDPNSEAENPYANLPKLNLYTYQMSEIVKDEIKQGVDIEGENYEYAFDLNEFFATDERGAFKYGQSVDKFLDALTKQEKYPFSTPELRNEIKHSFWLLNRVDSAKALARKLKDHPVFGNGEYEIVLAAGDGKLDDETETKKSYDKVVKAIAEHDKTITLSVGQLTTGVTIPEWTAVLMLSNVQSPSLYMQAAFRAQNPCLFKEGTKTFRKENAYVFDFDPARTLIIFEQFANDLYSKTASGKGDSETRKENVRQLLNFFPVVGEDENGEMVLLDAEKVLTIPRKLKSTEVVKRGFMSNYLFQNISNVFGAPSVVGAILEQLTPFKEGKKKESPKLDEEADKLNVDENNEIHITDEQVAKDVKSIFGDKVYKLDDIAKTAQMISNEDPTGYKTAAQTLVEAFKTNVVDNVVESAEEAFKDDIRKADKNGIKKSLDEQAEKLVHQAVNDFFIEQNRLESEMKEAIKKGEDTEVVKKVFEEKKEQAHKDFISGLNEAATNFVEIAQKEATKTIETKIQERKKESIEDSVRDRLRGFSRTIPSFLMAYGDDTVTLATFDEVIPDQVFVEVTSITLDQFRFLRDGGDYTDAETGEEKHYEGHLFDQVVFDDSVKEFLRLKKKLADYFDEKTIEDIFDYIPPQKTNQIYTPKLVVKKMVDMLEEENPGCFDEPEHTFIDMYMKSGLYITEIVKRLYQSPKMKELFPDDEERLRHIFEKQVYGLAPTEIIYNIAKNYILGFSENIPIEKHNIKLGDALPHAKAGDLEEWSDEVFGKTN